MIRKFGGAVVAAAMTFGFSAAAQDAQEQQQQQQTPQERLTFEEEQVLRIPLLEENANVQVSERLAGEVQVQKSVESEQKEFSVPLKTWSLEFARVPADQLTEQQVEDYAFNERVISIPIMEQTADIEKNVEVREWVFLRPKVTERQETMQTTVRSEQLDVQTEGNVETNPIQDLSEFGIGGAGEEEGLLE